MVVSDHSSSVSFLRAAGRRRPASTRRTTTTRRRRAERQQRSNQEAMPRQASLLHILLGILCWNILTPFVPPRSSLGSLASSAMMHACLLPPRRRPERASEEAGCVVKAAQAARQPASQVELAKLSSPPGCLEARQATCKA